MVQLVQKLFRSGLGGRFFPPPAVINRSSLHLDPDPTRRPPLVSVIMCVQSERANMTHSINQSVNQSASLLPKQEPPRGHNGGHLCFTSGSVLSSAVSHHVTRPSGRVNHPDPAAPLHPRAGPEHQHRPGRDRTAHLHPPGQ